MQQPPSPATVARVHARQSQPHVPGQALADLRRSFPLLLEEAARYGVDVPSAMDEWEAVVGSTQVSNLLAADSSPFLVAAAIGDIVARRDLPLLAYLAVEAILSHRSGVIAGYLRSSGASLESVLAQLADRLGEAFLSAAFSITWQRRALFTRLLEAARAYLEWTRQAQILAGRAPRRGVQTRMGIAAVLAARFGPISEHELRDARQMLLDSHARGSETALEYYVEASIWLYDLFEDELALRAAAQQLKLNPGSDAADSIMAAHLWLRLAGVASRPHGVESFMALAREVIEQWSKSVTNRHQDAALLLLDATLAQLTHDLKNRDADLSTRGVLFPFGHRRPDTPTASLFERSLPRLIEALRSSAWSNDFVYRDLTATFLSLHARSTCTAVTDATEALREAIATRSGSTKDRTRALSRAGIEVEQAADRFLLAHLTNSAETRRLGFIDLMKASEPDDLRPRYLTMIAKEVEERGALAGGLVPGPEEVALAVRSGDSATIFVAAARAAYSSADLTQVLLGGRGGVVTLRDSDGIAGQTFVYKRTRPEAKARDAAYCEVVAEELDRRGLSSRYGLIDHLADIVDVGTVSGQPDQIVSVRRFSDGVPLLDHLRIQEQAGATATLRNVAEFLAIIHFAGLPRLDTTGTRVNLKQSEVGRWLRALQLSDEERSALFDMWWSAIQGAPLVPRRDAHPLNWLIGSDDRIRAVDLESKGSRPFGYELAQLVEDGQVLPPGDYAGRTSILDAYLNSWSRLTGTPVDPTQFRAWYDAGTLARAVRAISQPRATPAQRAYGGDLLASLADNTVESTIRSSATDLAQRWNQMKGRTRETGSKTLSEADRRRISRAMSYHLRHDPTAPATKSGWVHVDELSQIMRAAGHRVTSAQLLLIAGALGEQRFELEDEDIRAAYGHSIPVKITYETRRPPEVLFHATPTRNLASVFEARAGLLPGTRNWVHLTESCEVAVNAARRQQAAVSVLEVDALKVAGLVFATGTTWLAPRVPIESIRIAAVRRVKDLTRDESGASP